MNFRTLVTWITFPGVIVHELAHQLFCVWTGTPVIRVCYFRFGNPAGYVVHGRPTSVWRHIMIGMGPLVINTGLGLGLGLLAGPSRDGDMTVRAVLAWLSVSVAMHAFPSTGDAAAIWAAVWERGAPLSARLLGSPLVALIHLGALGSVVWLDLAYGIAVGLVLPRLGGLAPA